jgi:hypothetical protein
LHVFFLYCNHQVHRDFLITLYNDGVRSEISCECRKRQKINKLLHMFRPVKRYLDVSVAQVNIYKKFYVVKSYRNEMLKGYTISK